MTVAQQISGKERMRGPNLVALVKMSNGVPMEEALAKADEVGVVIASNKRLSRALVGSKDWRSRRATFACWSGTMAAYDRPDQKLGKAIEYTDSETGIRYVFPVPEEHQGKKNIVLVAEHPEFMLVIDGKTRVVQSEEVGAVYGFPVASKSAYIGDPRYDIPYGKKVERSTQDARCLWRIDKHVGLIVRGYAFDYMGWGVDLCTRPSEHFGVNIEAASSHARKKTG